MRGKTEQKDIWEFKNGFWVEWDQLEDRTVQNLHKIWTYWLNVDMLLDLQGWLYKP